MTYACTDCGASASSMRDVCEGCGGFRTIGPTTRPSDAPARSEGPGPVLASEIPRRRVARARTHAPPFDRVLGGGGAAVPSSILLFGEGGAGKTTHAARMAEAIATALDGPALYLSAEMSAERVRDAAERDGSRLSRLYVWHVTDLDDAERAILDLRPRVFVFDSIQEFSIGREYGTDAALREVVRRAIARSHALDAVAILVSQVTGDGEPSGPHRTIHRVDTVLELTPESVRCARKNRFGETPREAKLSDGAKSEGARRRAPRSVRA